MMETLLICLPDGFILRLTEISALTGENLNDIVRGALEHTYIMTEKQREMLEKPLPF